MAPHYKKLIASDAIEDLRARIAALSRLLAEELPEEASTYLEELHSTCTAMVADSFDEWYIEDLEAADRPEQDADVDYK